ncbi:shikimate dehydrogenase [Pelagibacteraceae bacterium]|nr:shikimate dehydrogenase [Pelagibacteraceae bacterium]
MKKMFGIIGNPVKHSLSPLLHNYWFKKYKVNANYSIIDVLEKDLASIARQIKDKSLSGVNVTLPYKQKIINYADKIINDAKATGSVNTLLLDSDESLIGENTDVYGLQAAYLKTIDSGVNKKALVIGAGGVSPSVILSLEKCGIKNISITNRTTEKCLFLRKSFRYLNILPWTNLQSKIGDYDIIVNATSLGLKNGQDFDFDFNKCKNDAIYIDTIYNPLKTRTFKYLEDKGIKVFNGLDMFIYQGQKSFYLWNKINPEIDGDLVDLLLSKLK